MMLVISHHHHYLLIFNITCTCTWLYRYSKKIVISIVPLISLKLMHQLHDQVVRCFKLQTLNTARHRYYHTYCATSTCINHHHHLPCVAAKFSFFCRNRIWRIQKCQKCQFPVCAWLVKFEWLWTTQQHQKSLPYSIICCTNTVQYLLSTK